MSQDLLEKQCVGFKNTPPLWVNEQFEIQQFDFPEVDLTSFKPVPIPKNIRLGHQMEYVFKQLILHSEPYEIIVHNLAIKEGNRTIGEIDFILKDVKTQKLIHVELTYKFYIIDEEIPEPIHRLMGPNRRDTFFAKMEKIKNSQFQLLHSEEGAKALQDNDINDFDITHQTCFKAQLFIPFGSVITNLQPLNQKCVVGFWLRFDDFNTAEFKAFHFYIPSKSAWVVIPDKLVVWQSHDEIMTDINKQMLKQNSPMVWMKKSETVFEKFFVVWW